MKIGFVGLGRMGSNMVERLLMHGHEVVVYNRSRGPIEEAAAKGAVASSSLEDLVGKLPAIKVVWLMVPAGDPVDDNISRLRESLAKEDIIIDGGNSNWNDTRKRADDLNETGIELVDCGTSGGIWGLENGYCLMYGGDKRSCDYLEPIFKSLAPENGYIYCGGNGAGHFVKMVHNGIEYGMMQSYAEGFQILEKSPYELDLGGISSVWQHGSVIRSWLLELAERAFSEDPRLEDLEAFVSDSGEGRWTVKAAIDLDVPAPVITNSLYARYQSRDKDSFAMRVLAALRNQFGGHPVKKKEP
jgi:6-phosphogluconate dehydrogenase